MAGIGKDCPKYTKTVGIILIWIAYGLTTTLPGSTLTDLSQRLELSYLKLSGGIALRGVGVICGASLGGLVVERFSQQRMRCLLGAVILQAFLTASIPWSYNAVLLASVFVGIGLFNGGIQVVTQKVVVEMWADGSKVVLPLLTMGVVGSGILAPLIANPFLLERTSADNDTRECVNRSVACIYSETPKNETRVQYVYILVPVLCLVLSVPFFLTDKLSCFSSRGYEAMEDTMELAQQDTSGRNKKLYSTVHGLFVLVTVFLYALNSLGIYFINSVFIRSLSIDLYGFSRDSASSINSVYFLGAFTGCVASTFMVLKIRVDVMFVLFNVVLLVACCLLYALSTKVLSLFWVSTFIMGIPSGPLIGLFTAYTNTQIPVDGILLAVMVLSRGLADLVYVFLAGHVYNTSGPSVVLRLIVSLSIVVFLHSLLYVCVGLRRKRNSENN